jgi:hypothetical protein
MSTTKTRALDLSKSADRAFAHLLVNTLLVSVINFTVWFAVTFWVFLETRSVLATGMVAGTLGRISCQCRRGACCGVRSVRASSSVGSPSPRLA